MVRYETDYNQAGNVPQLKFEFETANNDIDEKMLREFVEVLSTQLVPGLVQWSTTEGSNGLTTILISPSNSVQAANKVEVNTVDNLPEAVEGARTLLAGYAYQFNTFIDLEGDRLECAGDVVIYGTSSETAGITSTGLDVNTPLITTTYSLPMQNIRIYDVGFGVDINGGVDPVAAVDWLFVNFVNVPKAFEVQNVTNWIGTLLALINSGGALFTGEIGTIGLNNSLLTTQVDGTGITIDENTVITRRARFNYSSIVSIGASSTGLDVSINASIPVESYILDTVSFSGNGAPLAGLFGDNDKTLAVNCTGITNSSSVGMIYMLENATATVSPGANQPTIIAGTTLISTITQRFSLNQTLNGLTYLSSVKRTFYIRMSFTFSGGNNKVFGWYLAVNKSGDTPNPVTEVITESEVYLTANGSRPDTGFSHALIELENGDTVYPVVESTDGSNVTVGFLNMIPTVAS